MANVALSAPTLTLGGITAAAGLLGAGTSINAATGITIAGNNGLLLLNIITVSSGGSSNFQFSCPNSANNPAAITLAASSSYWFGPFDPAVYNWPTGTTNGGLVVITGTIASVANTAQVFYIPASKTLSGYQSLHNPFEQTLGTADL
jgi:hypothetical protein